MNTRIAALFPALIIAAAMSAAHAQTPSPAPVGSTGLCKDGTYSDAPSKRGACAGHKGVKDWFASTPSQDKPATPAVAGGAAGAPAGPAAPTTTAAAPGGPAKNAALPTRTAAAGGGDGQVWVNSSSKVYHCPGTKYYGKTKAGAYMTEAAAIAAGDHADHGKACKSA